MSSLDATLDTSLPSDHAARTAALDPERSFAVSAPAGSGKTGLLTQRVLKLLARCENPEEVLGITFTRKAAQEMHHRISRALQEAALDAPLESRHQRLTRDLAREALARDQEKGWQLLMNPGRLRIQTIDAFCQSLVRQLPIAAGNSAYLETREDASGLYRAAVQELFRQLRHEGPLGDALSTLLRHMDNNLDTVERLLMQLLAQRSQWLPHLFSASAGQHYFEQSLHTIVTETLEAGAARLSHCLQELEELLAWSVGNRLDEGQTFPFTLDDIDLACDEPRLALDLWQCLVDMCLTNSDSWRRSLTKAVGFPAPSGSKNAAEKQLFSSRKQALVSLLEDFASDPALLQMFCDIRALPRLNVEQEQWALLESLSIVLPSLAALFDLHCQQVGEADFSEVAIAAARALGEEDAPTDLALKLDYQIRHILVDEFQDTSLPQLELLEKLTGGWQAGDGRTLFIVGDAMQSCYGFRDANVGIFIRCREQGIGSVALEPLNLTVNFRSGAGLVDWVNRNFEAILPPANDINRGAVCYSLAEACAREGEDQSLIAAHGFVNDDESAQARFLVQLVQQELDARPDDSIAILARSRSQLQDILRELRLAGLDWQARDIDALADRMAVIDLLSLTRALLDMSDRIAWLSLLRAPWCGIGMADLHTLANQRIAANPLRGRQAWPLVWRQILNCEALDLSADGQQRVARLRALLQPALAQKGRKPLRQWIEGVWLALGGPAAVANPAELHSPQHFFALLEAQSRGADIADWDGFESALARLYDKSESQSRLQVMTIHKSKGLEFDAVIIPKLDKGTRGDDKPLLLWQEYTDASGESHLLISPLAAVGGEEDRLYAYLKRERAIRQDYEAARLLYVACTRAISRLHLLMDLQRDEASGSLKAPGRNTLASFLWPALEQQIQIHECETAEGEAESPAPLRHLLRLPADWQAPDWPRDESLAAFRGPSQLNFSDDEDGSNRPDPSELNNRAQRYLGTVLHRALQTVTEDGLAAWPLSRVSEQLPLWTQQLRQLGLRRPQAVEAAEQIAQAVAATLADPTGRWLLDNRHEDSRSEFAISDGRVAYRESVIDRCFIAEGYRWIVDYKATQTQQDEAALLAVAEAEYAPQLRRYAQLMRRLDLARGRDLPVRTALYFPLIHRLHELK